MRAHVERSPVEAGPSPNPSADASSGANGNANADANANANANLACDETSDCSAGACCAERDTSGGGTGSIVTKCLPNCITNTPRVRVCKRDAECENGACRAFDCGPGAPALLYCARPDGCT